ncbi:MAG: dUTP diphosphatase [Candidatus Geothermincolia bacterium]
MNAEEELITREVREIEQELEAIFAAGHSGAVFLPWQYRSTPAHIFFTRDGFQALFQPNYSGLVGNNRRFFEKCGYACKERGSYVLLFEFEPGKVIRQRFEDWMLFEKSLPRDLYREEITELRRGLGYFRTVPMISLERADGTTGIPLKIKRLTEGVQLPRYAHDGDAGLDICSADAMTLEPGERRMVPTGFAMALPPGYAAFIQPRSGLAAKHGISIVNSPGLIDCHYRGEVQIILVNLGQEPFEVKRGDRIAQMVIQKVERVLLHEVEELDETSRGAGGFGSTGVSS